MDHYVVTGFDELNWSSWGESWIISLKELAKFEDNILVVDFGLTTQIKKKLADFGVYLLPGDNTKNKQSAILQATAEFAAKYPGIFAIWNADVYFQHPIDEIFSLTKEKIAITNDNGFYAACHDDLIWLREIQEATSFVCGDVFVFEYLKQFFQHRYIIVDETWNFTNVTKLHSLAIQKVIHPLDDIKPLLVNKGVLFWERYKDLYDKHCVVKHVGRKLVKKPEDVIVQQEV